MATVKISSTTNYKITTMDLFLHADAPDIESGR
jgi:hypothetical protein